MTTWTRVRSSPAGSAQELWLDLLLKRRGGLPYALSRGPFAFSAKHWDRWLHSTIVAGGSAPRLPSLGKALGGVVSTSSQALDGRLEIWLSGR
jgi:hypothetical protein